MIKCPKCNHLGYIPISYLKYKEIKCSECNNKLPLFHMINRYIVSLVCDIRENIINIESEIEIFPNIEIRDSLIERILLIKENINNIEIIHNNIIEYTTYDLESIKNLITKFSELRDRNTELELLNDELLEECNILEKSLLDTHDINIDEKIF